MAHADRSPEERALLKSERRFRDLATTAPGLVFETDRAGNALFVNNEQWHEFTGRPHGSWRGKGWADAIHHDDRDSVFSAWQSAVLAEKPFEFEYRFVHISTGRAMWVLAKAVPFRAPDGHILGHMGSVTDITALKEADEHKRMLEQALMQTQKLEAIGTLASGVAHDFNNVLAAVVGFVEIAMLRADGCDTLRELLERIRESAEQGANVTKGLLEFARSSVATRRPLDLCEFAEANVRFFKHLVPAAIRMDLKLFDGPLVVHADSSQMQQVLANLIGNARDAMPQGGALGVELDRCGDLARVVVRDSGDGIPTELLTRVFDPFFTAKAPGQGTGLGLAITHGIVTDHKGAIHAASSPGEGTTMTITLPLYEPCNSVDTQHPEPTAEFDGTNETVLLVDDNRLVRSAMEMQLKGLGCHVFAAEDGASAIQLFQTYNEQISVAILDVDLPDIDGVSLSKELLRSRAGLPVVLITGNTSYVGAEAMPPGQILLTKPLTAQELGAAISAARNPAEGSAPQASRATS